MKFWLRKRLRDFIWKWVRQRIVLTWMLKTPQYIFEPNHPDVNGANFDDFGEVVIKIRFMGKLIEYVSISKNHIARKSIKGN